MIGLHCLGGPGFSSRSVNQFSLRNERVPGLNKGCVLSHVLIGSFSVIFFLIGRCD